MTIRDMDSDELEQWDCIVRLGAPGSGILAAVAMQGRTCVGWSEARRARVAEQMPKIRHWRVIHGSYQDAPDTEASWFVDPPYRGQPGSHYIHGPDAIDYDDLAGWCRSRRGQVTVCEAEGATWLPFRPLGEIKSGPRKRVSPEAVWTNEPAFAPETLPLF
jgi:hypothetical protein